MQASVERGSGPLIENHKVSTPRSSHISPLHHQAVRGRTIILTERPQLHLVWYYDRIFIKPIPGYLLSWAFWNYLIAQPVEVRKAAVGFMRSYSYLVYSETDFILALEKGLIPNTTPTVTGKDRITWDSFARLITSFEHLSDEAVSPRYRYGELRLSRLNFYSRIFLRKLTFHHIDAQWGTFLHGAIAPFIVIFAILAVILNAMQVELAVLSENETRSSWAAFANASKWLAIVFLIFVLLVIIFICSLVAVMFFHDLWFARTIMREKEKAPSSSSWKTSKSGVV